MLPLFTTPLAFLTALAIPALIAIYLFRSRFRRYPVSSLMLWIDQKETKEGGTRRDRLQTPLLLLLEMLALLALVLAAAGPLVHSAQTARPVIVILDDSYSMQAGGQGSPRGQAVTALLAELKARPPSSVRFLLAGERPQVLGEPLRTAAEAGPLLEGWTCRAPTARIEEALALAVELGGDLALLLVVTDHPPAVPPEEGRLRWWSFGQPMPNLAFVNAARGGREGPQRCLLEIANLSRERQSTPLVIDIGEPAVEMQRSTLALGAGEIRRIILNLPDNAPAMRARIAQDGLAIDDAVTLMPVVERTVRVESRIKDDTLRPLIDRAVRSTRNAVVSAVRPEILITDLEGSAPAGSNAWIARLISEKEGEAYSGPFVIDRTHPLTEGLSLQGAVWGAGKTEQLAGAPVITAGNVPLLSDSELAPDRHEVRLRLRPDLSTIQDSPNWPILIWNLVQWRGSFGPGLARTNLRLGEEAVLTVPASTETVELTGPDGRAQRLTVQGKRVAVKGDDVGVYTLRNDGDGPTTAFAVNTLSRDESDLSACATGNWGDWLDETAIRLEYQNVSWLLVLAALGLLTLHLYFVAQNNRRARA